MFVGIDIEEISRFEKYDKQKTAERIFTKNEMQYCQSFSNSAQHYAGFWTAKEAVKKALSSLTDKYAANYVTDIGPADIEILHRKSGCPFVNLNEKLNNHLNQLMAQSGKQFSIEISISHNRTDAISICIINENSLTELQVKIDEQ